MRQGHAESCARAAKGKAIPRKGVWLRGAEISRSRLRRERFCSDAHLSSNLSLLAGYDYPGNKAHLGYSLSSFA